MSRYIVIGAGAVGAVIAGQWALAGVDVVLVARGEHRERIQADGLRIVRPTSTDVVPLATVTGPEELTLTPQDVLVLATKAQDAPDALAAWAWLPVTGEREGTPLVAADLPIITFQNGLATEHAALRRFATVYSATIAIASSYISPGEVASPSEPVIGAIWIGAYPSGRTPGQGKIVADLESAGFSVSDVDDIAHWKSWKLLGNVRNGLDVLTQGRDVSLGATESAASESVAAIGEHLVSEARAVLIAAGLPPAELPRDAEGNRTLALKIDEVPGYERHSSTWQSFARGKSSEIDYLNGEVTLLGRLHKVSTPYNTALQQVLGREEVGTIADVIDAATILSAGTGALASAATITSNSTAERPPTGPLRWDEPTGIAARGTLVILGGRGETPEVYERFGRRLSTDAYRVIALNLGEPDVVAAVREILADPHTAHPVVLVGSDTGAFLAKSIANSLANAPGPDDFAGSTLEPTVTALVLVGVPSSGGFPVFNVTDEIAARTSCPNHRQVLESKTTSPLFATAPTFALTQQPLIDSASPHLPTLAIHGSEDRISPLQTALPVYLSLGADTVEVVQGGLHDVLNDVTHRSVAATLVLFLERLRVNSPALISTVTAITTTNTSEPATPVLVTS